MLPGDEITYTITYANSSNIDLTDIQIIDTLPADVRYVSDNSGIPLRWREGNKCYWEIGLLPKDTQKTFQLRARVSDDVPGSTTLINKLEVKQKYLWPGMIEIDITNNKAFWSTHVIEEPKPDLFVKVKPTKTQLRVGEGKEIVFFYGNRGTGIAWDVRIDMSISGQVSPTGDYLRYIGTLKPGETGKLSYSVKGVAAGSAWEDAKIECDEWLSGEELAYANNYDAAGETIVRSTDPNDKLSTPQDFITPDGELTYKIRFENVATASIPAQYITIEDNLPAELNWNTFLSGAVSIGTVTYDSVEAFNSSGRGSLTLGYNPSTGKISYKFDLGDDYGTTGLKPNVNPPEGEGWVEFSVDTRATLTTGTKVTNTATIQFDWNEWINTPPVTNIVDLTAPTSTVKPLPALSTATTFMIGYEGGDKAGVEDGRCREYTIYVSKDGGSATVSHTENVWGSLSATFTGAREFIGEYGHTYGFYCQAMDAMGNTQAAPFAPQATIRLTAENIEIKASGTVAMEVGGSVLLSCLAKGTNSAVPATWTLTGDIGSLSCTFGTQATFSAGKIGKGVVTAFDGSSTTQIPIIVGDKVNVSNAWAGTLTANWGTATVEFGTSAEEIYLLPIGTVTASILNTLSGNIGLGIEMNAYGTSGAKVTGTLTNLVQVRFNYNEAMLGSINEGTLKLYISSDGSTWELVMDSKVDEAANIVYGTITHLSYIAPAGKGCADNLIEVFVYPNPCRVYLGQQLHFKRLTSQCTIKIFNIAGELVKEIDHTNGTDEEVWTNPNEVASGVYLYLITNNHSQKAVGKLGIIK